MRERDEGDRWLWPRDLDRVWRLRRLLAAADDQFFRDQVAPILERRCVHCHGGSAPKGNLSLTTAAGASKGGDGGPAVVPGKPDESLLIEMISGDKPAMPQKEKPLSNDETAAIRSWIETGASWPAGLTLSDRRFEGQAGGPSSRSRHPNRRRSASPWVRTPIDAFILAELQKHGLEPSPEADRRTLIRRLSFDLIGLPPTPEELEHFSTINRRTLMNPWSTACSPARITASAGAGTGSTWPTTATRTATTRTSAGTTPGPIAIT